VQRMSKSRDKTTRKTQHEKNKSIKIQRCADSKERDASLKLVEIPSGRVT
jgi:hypothetical protein